MDVVLFCDHATVGTDHKANLLGVYGPAMVVPKGKDKLNVTVFCRTVLASSEDMPTIGFALYRKRGAEPIELTPLFEAPAQQAQAPDRAAYERDVAYAFHVIADLHDLEASPGDSLVARISIGEKTISDELKILLKPE